MMAVMFLSHHAAGAWRARLRGLLTLDIGAEEHWQPIIGSVFHQRAVRRLCGGNAPGEKDGPNRSHGRMPRLGGRTGLQSGQPANRPTRQNRPSANRPQRIPERLLERPCEGLVGAVVIGASDSRVESFLLLCLCSS
jgi:hypothetical protein